MMNNQPKLSYSVPWTSADEWAEVQLSVQLLCDNLGENNPGILELARKIQSDYRQIDTLLEQLCAVTCTSCTQICCRTATVWYDLRDLLYIQLVEEILPKRQVQRTRKQECPNLRERGCALPRIRRPFICTWYICADQKVALASFGGELFPVGDAGAVLETTIVDVQESRKLLEQLCIEAACG